jgi:hypothetical protein
VKKILAAQDALHAVITLEMLLKTAYVDHSNIWDLLRIIADLEVGRRRRGRGPPAGSLHARRSSPASSKNVEFMLGLVASASARTNRPRQHHHLPEEGEREPRPPRRQGPPGRHRGEGHGGRRPSPAATVGPVIPGGITYEEIKVRSEEFTATLVVDGKEWRLVDMIDVLDKASEEDHKFQIKGAKDTYRTRQKLRYPDGTLIEDAGIAHEGGSCEFVVKNLTPHQDLVIVRRMDYVHGDFQAEIHVNGERLPRLLECKGEDKRNRWRNWPYTIPAQYINTNTITVKQVMLTADRDINMFKFWFYQPQPR